MQHLAATLLSNMEESFHRYCMKQLIKNIIYKLEALLWCSLGSELQERSSFLGEVPDDWKLENVFPVFNKSKKEDPGYSTPIRVVLVPGKSMEKIVLGVIEKHINWS